MRNAAFNFLQAIDRHLGRCPRCMKAAFLWASVSWMTVLFAKTIWTEAFAIQLLTSIAIGLTVLWTMHFSRYTSRVLALLWSEYQGHSQREPQFNQNRRDFFWIARNSLALGLLAAVWFPSTTSVAGSPCRPGRNCPDAAPKCCSRTSGICCDGNWSCNNKCFEKHADARKSCGANTTIIACS